MSEGFDAATGSSSVTLDEMIESPTRAAEPVQVGAKVIELVTIALAPRESFEERRVRLKAERTSFLVERRQRGETATMFLSRFAMQLAKAVNDLALQPKPEERWTTEWEKNFLKVWHEILFRESVQRALVLAKCELQELSVVQTSGPALSSPRIAASDYTDARCLGFLYAAFGRALERSRTKNLARVDEAENEGGSSETSATDITFRHDGPEYIAQLRRWDPSGRRSIRLYRKWTESRDPRRTSAVAYET